MLSLLGVFNFIWGEFSHSQWAKKLSVFILPIFVLFNGIILVSYKDLNLSTSELLMVVLGLSVFVNQLIYKSDQYLECHKELFLMYLLLASTNVHFSGLLLAAYLFGTKKEYLTIGFANLIIFSSLLSLFHWWGESWSDMSSLAIYSLLLTYLFFKMKRDRKFILCRF